MKVTGDMVRDLQQRVDVTYEEAERVLRRTRGDVDEAEILIKRRQESRLNRLTEEGGRIYRELLTYYVKIIRKGKTLVDLPLMILVGLFLIMTTDSKIWVGVVSIGVILISESTLSIYRIEKKDSRIIANTEEAEEEGMTRQAQKKNRTQDSRVNRETVKEPDQVQENDESQNKEVSVQEPMVATQDKSKPKEDDDDDYYEITIEK